MGYFYFKECIPYLPVAVLIYSLELVICKFTIRETNILKNNNGNQQALLKNKKSKGGME